MGWWDDFWNGVQDIAHDMLGIGGGSGSSTPTYSAPPPVSGISVLSDDGSKSIVGAVQQSAEEQKDTGIDLLFERKRKGRLALRTDLTNTTSTFHRFPLQE